MYLDDFLKNEGNVSYMRKIAVVTDSNSGITQKQAKELGVHVIPMPLTINDETYFEDINLSQDEFYEKLLEDTDISTSTSSIGSVTELWDSLLKEYEEIVHIPMSSGLSSSCEVATLIAKEYDGRVAVVNNQRISVTLRESVLDAQRLADKGYNASQIKEYLEKVKFESSIYIMVDTLKYLKKGGRITPAAAAIGTVLNIKPVLQIHGEKLDSFAKARGTAQARRIMIDALKHDLSTRFAECASPERMLIGMAYTYNKEAALDFKNEIAKEFPGYDIYMDPLALSISCHIGPGALAVACIKKLDC